MIHPVLIVFSASFLLLEKGCMSNTKPGQASQLEEVATSINEKLVNIAAEDLTSIVWMDRAGRKEVIQKEDNQWHYAGMERVDSVAFEQYLKVLSNIEGKQKGDLQSIQNTELVEILTLYGNTMNDPVAITVLKNRDAENQYLILSSVLKESIFISDSAGIYRYIFKDLRQFWPNGQ